MESRITDFEKSPEKSQNPGTEDPGQEQELDPRMICQGRGGKAESVKGFQTVLSYLQQIAGTPKSWMSEKWLSASIKGGGLRCEHWGTPVVVYKSQIVDWAAQGFPKESGDWTLRQILDWVIARHQMNPRTAAKLVTGVINDMGLKPISYPQGRIPSSLQGKIDFPTYRSEDYKKALAQGPQATIQYVEFGFEVDEDGPVNTETVSALQPHEMSDWHRRVQQLTDALPPFTAHGRAVEEPSDEEDTYGSKIGNLMWDGWTIEDPFRLDWSDEQFHQFLNQPGHMLSDASEYRKEDEWPEEWGEPDRELLGD